MPTAEQQPWNQELLQQLSEIRERYTPARYASAIETQHEYDYALYLLEADHLRRLDDVGRAERHQLDIDQRAQAGLSPNPMPNKPVRLGLFNVEMPERPDGTEVVDAEATSTAYRQTDDYRERLTELVEGQADRLAWSSRTIAKVYADLDERFGFPGRGLYIGDGDTAPAVQADAPTPQAPTQQEQAVAAWERAQQPVTPSSELSEHVASRRADYDGPIF